MVRRRARIVLPVASALVALVALAVVVLVVRDGTEPQAARAEQGRIVIVIDDFRFTPQIVRARPGRLTIELRNEGRLGHAFHVRRNNRLWFEEKRLAPGERRVVSGRLERGAYRAFDPLSNFEELGLYGTLSIR